MKLVSGGDHFSRFRRIAAGVLAGTMIIGSVIVPEAAMTTEAALPEWSAESETESLVGENAVKLQNEESVQAVSSDSETETQSSAEETIGQNEAESSVEETEKELTTEVALEETKSEEELEKELTEQRDAMNQVHKDMSTITVEDEDSQAAIAAYAEDEDALQQQRSTAAADLARLNSLADQSKALSENKTGTITNCEIVNVNGTYHVNVTVNLPNSVTGKLYLMELDAYEYSLTGKTPVATGDAASTVTLQTNLGNVEGSDSKLFSKFVVAVKDANGAYTSITAPSYITNPGAVAANTFAFPKTASKKGIQANPGMMSDSVELGIKHTVVNFCLEQMISQSGGIAYNYKGKTYYFNENYVRAHDDLLRNYYKNNIQVSFIVLLGKGTTSQGLLYDAALDTGKYNPNNYALDTSNKEDAEWVEAIMTFLGSRYSRTDGQNGQVVNWILGNELNTPMYYNWMGDVSFETYMNELTRTYRIFTTALKSCYSNARTYLSFDYFWGPIPNNTDVAFSTKDIVDSIDDRIESEGDINWNIAYHAYPLMLKDPVFWDDEEAFVNDSEDTRIINMKNIDVLTNYVEKNFGNDTRIILSEQGFSVGAANSTEEQMKQAASYAYAYYISESHDNIDAFIIRAHIDNRVETDQGFYFGLWSNKPGELESADKKRKIWEVLKYIDTPSTLDYTNPLLPWVDCVSAWDNKAPRLENFDINKFLTIDGSTGDDELPIVASLTYSAHVQNKGWTPYVKSGEKAGTTGSSLRLEGFKIKLETNVDGGVTYAAHVQNKGWMQPVTNNMLCGTTGKSLRIEAFWVRLTGQLEQKYDIYYRTHVQNKGWLGWASNGAYAGTSGKSLRMESFQIRLVEKGGEAPSSTKSAYLK